MAKAAKKGATRGKKKATARRGTATAATGSTRGTTARTKASSARRGGAAKSKKSGPESRRVAAQGEHVRDQVRDMTAAMLRGETLSPERVGGLFRDVMQGTMEAVDRALPPAFRSDKLREAVEGFATRVEHLAREAKSAGHDTLEPMKGMMHAARSASERPFEAMQDSMRSGARAAAGAASRIMSATGGALSGFAEGIADAAERSQATSAKRRRRGGRAS